MDTPYLLVIVHGCLRQRVQYMGRLTRVDKHFYTTKTILTHYKIDQKLDNPFIEYARYVLADGTDSERTFLASNMGPMLQIKDGELEFYR